MNIKYTLLAILMILIGASINRFLQTNSPDTHTTVQKNVREKESVATPENKKTRTLYALGDSLTAGYQLPFEESYPSQLQVLLEKEGSDIRVVNAGKSGDTSAGLLARLDWTLAEATSGDIALLVIGANDGLQSLSLEQLEENLSQIIETLQSKNIQVIIGGMQVPTNLNPTYREAFKQLYPKLAETYDTPLLPFFLEDVAAVPELNLPDRIHPNKKGYEIIANNILTFIRTVDILE